MAVKDAVLDRAVDLARSAALEVAELAGDVGEHLGASVEGERLVAHRFACLARGYHGWQWTVTVARVPRGRVATVCEAVLLPGPEAILAKAWLPWSERLRPGDIGPGDVLPFKPDDPRLEPGWTPSGDPELDDVAIDELALARERVLSSTGRDEAATRWYRGAHGPTSAGALTSTAACATCGFLVLLQGSLGQVFGVCANEWSPEDGRVVSLDHGCGAHSQTDVEPEPSAWPEPDPLVDELLLDVLPARAPAPADDEPVEPSDEAAATAESSVEPVELSDETAEPVVPVDEAVADRASDELADLAADVADGPEPGQ